MGFPCIFRLSLEVMALKLKLIFRLMRLDAPWGAVLLILPCWWGLALAGCGEPSLYVLFAVGGVLMRSFGCIVNDLWDSSIDKQVARTATRPIASGQVSVRFALGVAMVLLGLSALVVFQFAPLVVAAAVMALPLVVLYPLAKRVFFLPQLVLAVVFNWGVWLGWLGCILTTRNISEIAKADFTPPALLYLAGIGWTLFYDSIYSLQDKADDKKLRIHSAAVYFSHRIKVALAVFATFSTLAFACYGLLDNNRPIHFWLGAVIMAGMYGYILSRLRLTQPATAHWGFIASMWVGVVVWLGLLGSGVTG